MNNQEPAWKNFVQSVTPELAEEWLRLHANPRNRKVKVSDSRVQSWAREQRAGAWKINPFAPIGFATGGMLLNGHNRLTAQNQQSRSLVQMAMHGRGCVRFDVENPDCHMPILKRQILITPRLQHHAVLEVGV